MEHNQQSKPRNSSQDLDEAKLELLTSKVTAYRSREGRGSTRESRSTVPRTIKTAIIASPRNHQRSRSADPATRYMERGSKSGAASTTTTTLRSQTRDTNSKRRSRSVEPARTTTLHKIIGQRSQNQKLATLEQQYQRQFQSVKEMYTDSTSSLSRSDTVPMRLEKDMIHLADGLNLDPNTRCLLAAFDARTLDDFYLMSDNDFSTLVFRAKMTQNSLPPLQIRKVQMLRRWLSDLVEENINGSDSGRSRSRKRDFRLIPKDWKDQYKNDLPHLKVQLRQQGDSILERFRIFGDVFACGTTSIY